MKKLFLKLCLLCLLVFLCQSCQPKQTYFGLVAGTWRTTDSLTQEVYVLKNGKYNKKSVYDSVRLDVEGSYFINENENRACVTLTLLPNETIPFDPDLITLLPCENLDIVSINGEKMVVVRSNFIEGKIRNTFRSDLDTLWRVDP